MTNEYPPLKVLVTKRVWYGGHTEYQAFCERCLETVASPGVRGGNRSWQTKPPAVSAARHHVEVHHQIEARLERLRNGDDFGAVVVAEVTA